MFFATDWSRQNRTWFAAVQVEKRMMGIILFLIVLVGAFGLVSSLVMTVNSKRSDIAILRTQGATRGSIMRIFMVQGAFIGTGVREIDEAHCAVKLVVAGIKDACDRELAHARRSSDRISS